MELHDTLRSPHRARTAQPAFSETAQTINREAHTSNAAEKGVAKAYATNNVRNTGSTTPSLGEVADPATPSMGSSFSDLDSMSNLP